MLWAARRFGFLPHDRSIDSGIPGEYSAAMLTLFFLEKIVLFCKLQTIVPEELSSP